MFVAKHGRIWVSEQLTHRVALIAPRLAMPPVGNAYPKHYQGDDADDKDQGRGL